MDETEIRSFFARYGSVKEVKIITDRTGVSKGWVKHMFNINYNKYLNYNMYRISEKKNWKLVF